MSNFAHIPVLAGPVVELAAQAPAGWLVDCTVGGAGHAAALLRALPQRHLLAIDRDQAAVTVATERLAPFGKRVRVMQGCFSDLVALMQGANIVGGAALVLADFGVSSHQLDTATRGFSFMRAASLDMRMDPSQGVPAAELMATLSEAELISALKNLGEERYARRIARAIVASKPQTTQALATLVRTVVPPSRDGIHPATRTFQAIRMLVNDELGEIDAWLAALPGVLADHGVAVAISFHSLEDRAVKRAFRGYAKGCICPPMLPVCACGQLPCMQVLTSKPRTADGAELAHNVRARSARLRAARRLERL